ncbi:MAG TPA: GNAT family N-acetyltransferase [Solirubrobacterales bacterium]|nr:GNAT family N-acetyltransferase [Solirubrobacterales bacterium]
MDDLSTLPRARRRGHGRQLLDWLVAEAGRLGCEQVHLDTPASALTEPMPTAFT